MTWGRPIAAALVAALGLGLAAAPAAAAIGQPIELGTASATTGKSVTLTLAAACPAAATVLIVTGNEGGEFLDPAALPVDSGGSVYTLGNDSKPATGTGETNIAWSIHIPVRLEVGSTLKVNWTNNHGLHQMGATCIPGVGGLDSQAANSRGIDANPTASSGALAQPNNELTFFSAYILASGADGGYVEDESVTPDGAVAGTSVLRWSHIVPPSVSPVLYGPQSGAPFSWMTKAVTFLAVPIPVPKRRAAAVMIAGSPPAPPVHIIWGYQYDPNVQCPSHSGVKCAPIVIRALNATSAPPPDQPVALFREGVNINQADYSAYADDFALMPAGVKALANIKNKDTDLHLSVPAAGPEPFKSQIKAFLTQFAGQIGAVTVENEYDSANNIVEQIAPGVPATTADLADRAKSQAIATATAAAFDLEMTYAAQAVHEWNAANGGSVIVGLGGISSSGVREGYWYYLWTTGQREAADRYKAYAFSGSTGDGGSAADLPDLDNPDLPIFGSNVVAYTHILQVMALIAGARATGMDDFSAHLFWSTPYVARQIDAVQWVFQASGMPVISDAVGQKNSDPLTTAGVASLGTIFGLRITSFFGAPAKIGDRAFPIHNDDGSLNERGLVLRAIIEAHP